VTLLRQRPSTLIFMTALAVTSALVMALCIGYHFGRSAGSTPPSWKKRTTRVALGRLAISLLMLMTVRRIRRRFLAKSLLRDAIGVWAGQIAAPFQLLRGSFARLPFD
jgi:hypothetical protein